MDKPMPNLPIHTFEISSKSKSKLTFFKDYFEFKIESDHTPRKLFYTDIKMVKLKTKSWFLIIYTLFIVLFFIVNIYLYFFLEESSILNFIVSCLLIILCTQLYIERKNQVVIVVYKGSLQIEIFRSSNQKETNEIFSLIDSYRLPVE